MIITTKYANLLLIILIYSKLDAICLICRNYFIYINADHIGMIMITWHLKLYILQYQNPNISVLYGIQDEGDENDTQTLECFGT